MNFLAHAFLSFDQPGLLAGNMISDFVKGKKQYTYSSEILSGINLHRAIDAYTDSHEAIREMKSYFTADFRLYNGAVADVVLDYFVANDTHNFADEQCLMNFTQRVYYDLDMQSEQLPENFLQTYSYMKKQNWLYNYRSKEGLHKSLTGLQRRSRYIESIEPAFDIFLIKEDEMKKNYDRFFPDVKKYATDNLPYFIEAAALSLKP